VTDLRALLAAFVLLADVQEPVRLTVREGWIARTYPAEAFLEGQGAVIALSPSVLGMSWENQRIILAHEVGHVVEDMDAIRSGVKVDCKRASRRAKKLLRDIKG